MLRTLSLILIAACFGSSAAAATEASYDKLANELVAPCCWQEALALHRSPAADQARGELRALIDEGRSDAEIREWFVAKYGERILLTPEGGKAKLLFWIPALATAAAFAAAAFALRRWMKARKYSGPPLPPVDLDDSQWDW